MSKSEVKAKRGRPKKIDSIISLEEADSVYHVSLLANVYIMIATTIILSIVGTIMIEKIVAGRLGRYRVKKEIALDDFDYIGEEISITPNIIR